MPITTGFLRNSGEFDEPAEPSLSRASPRKAEVEVQLADFFGRVAFNFN
jgi:hypothetical protein